MTSISNRLENWGWVMRPKQSVGRAGSAEGRYLRERTYDLEERRVPRAIVDSADARLVEAAWVEMTDRKQKNLLRLFYVRGCPVKFICRRQDIHPLDWELHLGRAQAAIDRLLHPLDVEG